MGAFADSAMGKTGAIPVPILQLRSGMGSTEDSSCFITASRCEHALFLQRGAGTRRNCQKYLTFDKPPGPFKAVKLSEGVWVAFGVEKSDFL